MSEASSMSSNGTGSSAANDAPLSRPTTAGAMLRHARQAQGLHIAALAATIKVLPRKLELLESDQIDQLPDPTFARALAQTVCRALKIDAAPVLALMPPPLGNARLEHVAEGLKAQFDERAGRSSSQGDGGGLAMPVVVIVLVLLIGAAAVYLMPASWLHWSKSGARAANEPTAAASASVTEVIVPKPTGAGVAALAASAPSDAMPPPSAAETPPLPNVAGVLQLQPTEACWVEVVDARGKTLIARLVQPGEAVGLDGDLPFKVKIGNAVAMQATFRGQPVDLGPFVRDSMAKLELK